MGHAAFLAFAEDFGLSSDAVLSTIELGDIFLTAVDADVGLGGLTLLGLWEALVRCALVALGKISDATILNKLRSLLLHMWRASSETVPRAFADGRRSADVLAAAMLFNKRFTAQWAADGYRDYLSPEARAPESGQSMLDRLMRPNTVTARALQATYESALARAAQGASD